MQAIHAKFLAFRVFRSRDGEAYRQLYRTYQDPIVRFLAFKLPRREDVDEVTSEVFLRGWEYMTSNVVQNPQALFYKIAHNLVANFYRDQAGKKHEELTDVMLDTIPSGTSLVGDIEAKEGFAELLEKISAIKEEYRQVIILRYIEEQSIEEIAAILGKTANNVRVLLFRAKNAIKKIL